jgi:hypothetical protein
VPEVLQIIEIDIDGSARVIDFDDVTLWGFGILVKYPLKFFFIRHLQAIAKSDQIDVATTRVVTHVLEIGSIMTEFYK